MTVQLFEANNCVNNITKALGIVTRIYITKISINEIRNYREYKRMEKDEIEEKKLIIT